MSRPGAVWPPAIGVGTAAGLYGVYHVGYGIGRQRATLPHRSRRRLRGRLRRSAHLLVLWPLLTPLGSFCANLDAGDIELPWASIAGFVDVFALMVLAGWLAARHQRKRVEAMTGPLALEPDRRVG